MIALRVQPRVGGVSLGGAFPTEPARGEACAGDASRASPRAIVPALHERPRVPPAALEAVPQRSVRHRAMRAVRWDPSR